VATREDPASELIAAGARLGRRGLVVAAEGNLSVRLEIGILITPSGRRKDELAADDLVLVPFEPAPAPTPDQSAAVRRPSSDLAIHRAIYRARPDVMAIVHAHLPAALALTIVGSLPDPADLPETALLLPRLPFVPFATPGSAALASAVARALTDGTAEDVAAEPGGAEPGAAEPSPVGDVANAVLLERHGAIAVGPDLEVAGDRLELVDLLCRVHRDVILLRAALGLDR
jgi:3-dehydro-4-phosphotetronate decarboxylase